MTITHIVGSVFPHHSEALEWRRQSIKQLETTVERKILVHINDRNEVHFLAGAAQARALLDIGGTPYVYNDAGERFQIEMRGGKVSLIGV